MIIDPSEPFFQARLKHYRAHQHISQFITLWNEFLQTDFCEVCVEDHPKGGQFLRVRSKRGLPPDLILTLGDAVHNLKSALDFTISELLGWKNTRLTFPMDESREELERSFVTEGLPPCVTCRRGKGKGRNADVEIAVQGIGRFIVDEIRPYKAANGFLWPLNKLDVRDKHRLLVPVVIPQTVEAFGITDNDGNRFEVIGGTVGPRGVVNLAHLGAGGVKVERYGKPTAKIFFNEVGVIEGQPVIPTLMDTAKAVAETIKRIEEFAVSAGWRPRSS